MSDLPVLDHWVGGAAWPGTSTRTAPVYDPARGEAQREVRLAGADDVAAAVASATAVGVKLGVNRARRLQSVTTCPTVHIFPHCVQPVLGSFEPALGAR
ncbi:MAG TPA: hypothetical protein DIS91_08625 [Microbacterium sp.]|nr:hypothetical protein [Microbacterium sp.]